jgi:hypothetical protein
MRHDEEVAARDFNKHASLCHTCHIDDGREIVVLCDRGCPLAQDVQQLLSWRAGFVQSTVCADKRFYSERIELPARYHLVERFLKTAGSQQSPVAPVKHEHGEKQSRRDWKSTSTTYAPIKQWRNQAVYFHSTVERCRFMTVRERKGR